MYVKAEKNVHFCGWNGDKVSNDLIQKWRPIYHSFIFIIMSPPGLILE